VKSTRLALGKIGLLILLLGTGLHATPAEAGVGCPWGQSGGVNGMGMVDANATYQTSLLPTNLAAGSSVQIFGHYPKVRFFSFTVYTSGKLIDHIADTSILPIEGGPSNPNVAAIPYSNDYTDTYRITIKFEDAPAQRETNTLYVGTSNTLQRVLLMRIYLPNPGANNLGDVALPQLTQVNPDGTSMPFNDGTGIRCVLNSTVSKLIMPIPLPFLFLAPKIPAFTIVPPDTYNGNENSRARYANFDAGYGYVVTSTSRAALIVIRARTPFAPNAPVDPGVLQLRYFSLCEYRLSDRIVIGCLADPAIVSQDDGYFNVVLSLPETRPVYADTAYGYNWLTALPSSSASFTIVRQVLPLLDFPGNYMVAGATAAPLAALGEWAPMVTYCDTTTFSNNALLGGAALFAACKAAYQH
jgi:hypothetical protein